MRKVVLTLCFGLLVSAFTGSPLAAAEPLTAARPNIVLIVSDDQHWGDYGFMQHPTVQTPNLDRLSRQGLLFTKGYVPASLCCPSLASLITGLYPHEHGITGNDPPNPKNLKGPDFHKSEAYRQGRQNMVEKMRNAPALPKLLAEEGYLSLQTGKWWLEHFSNGGFTHGMSLGGRHGDVGLKIGRETMQPIDDFLDVAQKEKKPFFLWYAPMLPHQPHNPPERLLQKYVDKTASIQQARYWANVEWFDETCGQLLDTLDRRGLSDNTVVVYLGDNGWIQDQDKPHFAPKSKQSPNDGGLRTPIIIRLPGKVSPGRDDVHRVSSLDIAATVLRLAGHAPVAAQSGIDLLDAEAVAARHALYGACFTHDFVDLDDPVKNLRFRWMIEDDWKLIVPSATEGGLPQLFDLAKDPHEENDLAGTEKKRIEDLLPKLDKFLQTGNR
ncbi:MAG: sulfatase [Verrucomicrobiota bacterium]|nr:sulfatase [Verrucomicrobiota bacterium]